MNASSERGYSVELVPDASAPSWLATRVAGRNFLLVSTPTVWRLYGKAFETTFRTSRIEYESLIIECTEQTKSIEQVISICRFATKQGLDRKGILIGLGGGVCTDLVTMAASMFRRGIDYIRLPTTLIGQVDAGIGIKGGVNFESHK